MKELVEYIAKSLVDQPDEVQVAESPGSGRRVVNLRVAPEDMGKVIGKQGHIAQAMRTLLKVAAAREGSGNQPVLIINAIGQDVQESAAAKAAAEGEDEEEL